MFLSIVDDDDDDDDDDDGDDDDDDDDITIPFFLPTDTYGILSVGGGGEGVSIHSLAAYLIATGGTWG